MRERFKGTSQNRELNLNEMLSDLVNLWPALDLELPKPPQNDRPEALLVEGNKLVFETVLPGADSKDLIVELNEGNFLYVEYKPSTPNRFASPFMRRWNVGNVTADKITVKLELGVLRVEVEKPVATPPKAVRIPVL
jgi:HSP20 family molecular chaperone IbpA